MLGAPSDVTSTRFTVECLTVTASPVRSGRYLTAAIAEEVGLLGRERGGQVIHESYSNTNII